MNILRPQEGLCVRFKGFTGAVGNLLSTSSYNLWYHLNSPHLNIQVSEDQEVKHRL